MGRKLWKISICLLMTFSTILGTMATSVKAEESYIVVDDTETSSTNENYFTYSNAMDPSGLTGWAADTKSSIISDMNEAKTQHWVWNSNSSEAAKHTYRFTFVGTGVEIVGVKNDSYNNFQLDNGAIERTQIIGTANTPTILYSKKGLPYGNHTVDVTLDGAGSGLQVSYAKVFGSKIGEIDKTTISHKKTDGSNNKFTFSPRGWSSVGNDEHVWSDVPSASLNASDIWYEVSFVGNKIDVYAGKNTPMGKVEYFIDGQSQGKYNLYNSSNINSTLIATFANLSEGAHTFKAVATGEKDSRATNFGIDCSKVVVYHAPYAINDIILQQSSYVISEGAQSKIAYTIDPDYAMIEDMQFVSLDETIASVDAQGIITAKSEGMTSITLSSSKYNISKSVDVTVKATNPDMSGSIVDTNTQYIQTRYEEVKNLGLVSKELDAWQNDKAISEIAIVSKNSKLKNVTITTSDLVNGSDTIAKENIKATFIKSTKAYNGAYLGYGSKDRPIPVDNGTNRSESSDILYQTTPMDVAFNKVQPIWVEFAIPKNAKAGTYTTTIEVSAEGISTPLSFQYTIVVKDVALNDASTFGSSFDIELWQYPYSSAEYYGVVPFSDEHLEIMKSGMDIYKGIGGHAITTTISEDAWTAQTYSKNEIHYPSMVKWTKKADGSFAYDYTDFDKWVQFNKDIGIADKIVVYSIAPWHNSFTYWENGAFVKEGYTVGSPRYMSVWKAFLRDLIDHLMEKGWFDETYIGIDERGFSKTAFDLVDSVRNIHDEPLKTAGAMDGFVDKPDLALRVTDLNVGDTAAAAHPSEFTKLVKDRTALGYKTTLYSCTEHQPGNFSLSAPVESYWSIINAGKESEGFLRWAYDAWVEDPLNDATHNSFEPGDAFLIYPDKKDALNPVSKSSVRLEKMAEGIRDVNKLRQMVKEIPALQSDVDAMYAKLKLQARTSRSYLSADAVASLSKEMDEFKKDITSLTDKYIVLKENGTSEVSSVTILEGNQSIHMGNTLQLHAKVTPDNVLNNSVEWVSSNDKVVSVTATGVVSANQIGSATIRAISKQDSSKFASVQITVSTVEIDEKSRVSYYSFDDGTADDAWGTRDGSVNGATFEPGKSGNALRATESNNVLITTPNTIGENDPWTISYWVKSSKDLTARTSVLMDKDKNYSFDLKMASDRSSGYHVGKNSGDVLTFAYAFEKEQWYHLTWTQSKTDGLFMYVNGKLVDKNLWTKTNRALAPLDIIGGTGFDGYIDELKVYNKVLNASEINSNMLVKGLNLSEHSKSLFEGSTYLIESNLISDMEDKTIVYQSDNPNVATVDEQGMVHAIARGKATITVENVASGYKDSVVITVAKNLTIKSNVPQYRLDGKYLSDIEKKPGTDRQYLGQPDMVRTKTGRLITAYPKGHGKGPIIMQISDDEGKTWVEKTDTPSSWVGSQETPTMYVLNLANGVERIMLITACPGWGSDSAGNQYGWNTSYSDDNGQTWKEYSHWYSKRGNTTNNDVIVGMASLIQLKDEQGNLLQKWMGVYHTYGYVNYKTILSFDENGNEQWSEPEAYLSEYRNIESTYQMCEIGMFRSPDGKRIVGLARSQSHNNPATLIYSDDEGKTWSEPMDLPGSLAGERHKAVYDPISKRLVITFREIKYDLNNNNKFDGNSDWTCGEWVAWVGTYEDLMNQEDGDYTFIIAEDWANNAKSGDTGYAGVVVLEDGTFIMDSYGHWDKDFSLSWSGGVTTDLCYIKQAKFKLGDLENANQLVNRDNLDALINQVKDTDAKLFSVYSFHQFSEALAKANEVNADTHSQQVEVDATLSSLKRAHASLITISTLEQMIASAENIRDKYTVSSFKALHDLLIVAKQMSTNAVTQAEVDAMIEQITTIMNGNTLVLRGDVKAIADLLAVYSTLEESDYTVASWEVLKAAQLEASEMIKNYSDVSQINVSEMLTKLTAAYEALELESIADLTTLITQSVDIINRVEQSLVIYLPSTYNAFEAAYEKALEVQNNSEATSALIYETRVNLSLAITNLVEGANINDIANVRAMVQKLTAEKDNFTDVEFKDAQDAIDKANAMLKQDEISYQECFAMFTVLNKVYAELSKIDKELATLKKNLAYTIAVANEELAKDVSNIRPSKVQALRDAIQVGQALLDANVEDKEAYISATQNIMKAVHELWDIVNKDKLNELIIVAKTITGNYTQTTQAELDAAIANAMLVAENKDATTSEVSDASKRLQAAMRDLVSANVSKIVLQQQVLLAKVVLEHSNNYLSSSIRGLQALFNDAQILLTNENATQSEVDAMSKKLVNALAKVRLKADKSVLEEVIAQMNSFDYDKYTTNSIVVLRNAMFHANEVLKNENATQIEVDNAVKKVQQAKAHLVKMVDKKPVTPNRPFVANGNNNQVNNSLPRGNNANRVVPIQKPTETVKPVAPKQESVKVKETPLASVNTTNEWQTPVFVTIAISLLFAVPFMMKKKKNKNMH